MAPLNGQIRSTAALLCGVTLLGVAWLLSPPSSPPLYDGLILGDEPYRYLNPPAGYRTTPPPSSARLILTVRHGGVPSFTVSTSETPPQAQLTGPAGALRAPVHVNTVTVTLTPVLAPAPAPAGDRVDGNTYRFQALAAGIPVGVAPAVSLIVALRGTGASGQPTLALFDGHAWSLRPTVQTGTPDDYAATIAATGDIALVLPLNVSAHSNPPGPSPAVDVEVVGLFAGLLAALLVLLRIGRRPEGG
ncbi:MAG TPA: hypothetical protein VNG13_00095 [Mycobacteriales bacterium]|nr:hypothetical protein [Mycobacteriales bacterium]